jgi:mycoredoxin
MPHPITIFGEPGCEETDFARAHLRQRGAPFREVDIQHHAEAAAFVVFVNGGNRSTPTIVFGDGKFKIVLTEPDGPMLDRALRESGYEW